MSRPDLFAEPEVAGTTAKALELLQVNHYDVLLADLILPRRLGGYPTEDNGLDLLRSSQELDASVGASFALSITRAEEVSPAVREFFEGHPWGLLRCRDDSTDFLEDLLSIAGYIQREIAGQHERTPTVDALVITALMEPELSAVETLIPSLKALRPLDVHQSFRVGELGLAKGRKASVAVAHAERMGPVHAAISTAKLCQAPESVTANALSPDFRHVF